MPSAKKKSKQDDDDVKVVHCNADIQIDLEERRLVGAVEITLVIQKPGLQHFRLHARQLKVCSVYVDGEKTAFDYHNYLDDVMAAAEVPTRQLKAFNVYHKAALEADDSGSLVIRFPDSFSAEHRLHQQVKVRVEYVLDQPRGGVEFAACKEAVVVEEAASGDPTFPPAPTDMTVQASGPGVDKSVYATLGPRRSSPVHVFAQKHALSIRSWLPCINKQSQQCTWSFTYHCKKPNIVVSSGDLVGTTITVRPKLRFSTSSQSSTPHANAAPSATASAPPAPHIEDVEMSDVHAQETEHSPDPETVAPGESALPPAKELLAEDLGEPMEIDSNQAELASLQDRNSEAEDLAAEQKVIPMSSRSRRGGQKKSPVSLSRQFSSLVDDTAVVVRTLRCATSPNQETDVSPSRRRSPRSLSPKKPRASTGDAQQSADALKAASASSSSSAASSSEIEARPTSESKEPCDFVMEEPTFTATSSPSALDRGVENEDSHKEEAEGEDSSDMVFEQLVTYRFDLSVPTAAEDIGFACGPFEVLPDASVPLATHFCLPGGMPVLQHTTALYGDIHNFLEDYLGNSYPYDSYKQVFVDGCAREGYAFAGLSILDKSTMHDSSVVDDAYVTRLLQARLLGEQWFGCFTMPKAWADNWLRFGVSSHLMSIYARHAFGANEARYQNWKLFEEVVKMDVERPPLYWKGYIHPAQTQDLFFLKKAQLVMSMIVECVGTADFQKILSNMTSINLESPSKRMWLSTRKFMTTMKKATLGPDVKALERQWVMGRGCPKGVCAFQYNKKRQQTEFAIQQTLPLNERFTGSLCVRINELDGTYDHVVQVDDILQGFDFECNSRLRKNRKKKYRYVNGDEIIVNLTNRDNPLLWIRVDPQLNWGPALVFKQPMYMWIFQLQMDRDYVAQLLAVEHIADEPTEGGMEGLRNTLANTNAVHFHRTRTAAAMALARVNRAADFSSLDLLIGFFKDHFYDSKKTMPLPNDFSDLVMYYLKMGLVNAIGSIRAKDGKTPKEVLEFLLELLRDDDNSLNSHSEYTYISTIIRALGGLEIEELIMTSTPRIIAEIERWLKFDQLIPSFNFGITVSCLSVLCSLQKAGKAARDLSIFFRYMSCGQHVCVRIEAFRSLLLLASHDDRVLSAAMSVLEDAEEPSHLKCEVIETWTSLLRDGSVTPAQYQTFLSKNKALCDKIWVVLNSSATSFDARLRVATVALYRNLWGRGTPLCLDIHPGSDDALAKLATSAAKAKKQKRKRRASEAGLAPQSTIRISLKRQRVGDEDDDEAPSLAPPSTPLYAKPSRSRIRVRASTGGDQDDDEYVPPGGAPPMPVVKEEQLEEEPLPPAPEVLSASSSGTKLKFTIRMSSSSVTTPTVKHEPNTEAPEAHDESALAGSTGESNGTLVHGGQPPGALADPPLLAEPGNPSLKLAEDPAQPQPAVKETCAPEQEQEVEAQQLVGEQQAGGEQPAAEQTTAVKLEEDDAPVPKIRLRMSFSGM